MQTQSGSLPEAKSNVSPRMAKSDVLPRKKPPVPPPPKKSAKKTLPPPPAPGKTPAKNRLSDLLDDLEADFESLNAL